MKRPDLKKCPKFIAFWLRMVLDYCDSVRPQPGIGISITDAPSGGQTVSLIGKILAPLNSATTQHNYTVNDASSGATPGLTVTPGNHQDGTGSGTTWIPTIGGTTIDTLPAPVLNPTAGDTKVYFKLTTNPQDGTGTLPSGKITAAEINSGTSVPDGDNTTVYQLCANITASVTDGVAKVTNYEGGVSGSQAYQYCSGPLLGLQ